MSDTKKKWPKILVFFIAVYSFLAIAALQLNVATEIARNNAQTSSDCSKLLDLSDIFTDASYCEYKITHLGEGKSWNHGDIVSLFVTDHYEVRGVVALSENVDISEGFSLEIAAKELDETKEFIEELDYADWVKIADWYILKNFRNTLYADIVFDRNTNLLYFFIVSISNEIPIESGNY